MALNVDKNCHKICKIKDKCNEKPLWTCNLEYYYVLSNDQFYFKFKRFKLVLQYNQK